MTFYRGKGVPGQPGYECEEFKGFDTSPNGKYWGSEPIGNDGVFLRTKKEQKAIKRRAAKNIHRSKYHK